MQKTLKITLKKLAFPLLIVGILGSLQSRNVSNHIIQQIAEAGETNTSQAKNVIKIDGSSTLHPITEEIVQKFSKTTNNKTKIEVNISGTSGGFKKFCTGKIQINNASRPISLQEMAECKKNGVKFIELPIAFDALTVVVHRQNNWAKDITVSELKKIWQPEAEKKITTWNQIRSSWPNTPITLYGPGNKSGTFDYFTEAIVGKAKSTRQDYTSSHDYNVLATKISKDPLALGYLGHAYYEKNNDKLNMVAINNGKSPIFATQETVQKSQYQPLSRPLFIYVNIWSGNNRGEIYKFVDFYLQKAPEVIKFVDYVPLPETAYHINYVHLHQGKSGTVFAGKSKFDLTITELLRRQKQF